MPQPISPKTGFVKGKTSKPTAAARPGQPVKEGGTIGMPGKKSFMATDAKGRK